MANKKSNKKSAVIIPLVAATMVIPACAANMTQTTEAVKEPVVLKDEAAPLANIKLDSEEAAASQVPASVNIPESAITAATEIGNMILEGASTADVSVAVSTAVASYGNSEEVRREAEAKLEDAKSALTDANVAFAEAQAQAEAAKTVLADAEASYEEAIANAEAANADAQAADEALEAAKADKAAADEALEGLKADATSAATALNAAQAKADAAASAAETAKANAETAQAAKEAADEAAATAAAAKTEADAAATAAAQAVVDNQSAIEAAQAAKEAAQASYDEAVAANAREYAALIAISNLDLDSLFKYGGNETNNLGSIRPSKVSMDTINGMNAALEADESFDFVAGEYHYKIWKNQTTSYVKSGYAITFVAQGIQVNDNLNGLDSTVVRLQTSEIGTDHCFYYVDGSKVKYNNKTIAGVDFDNANPTSISYEAAVAIIDKMNDAKAAIAAADAEIAERTANTADLEAAKDAADTTAANAATAKDAADANAAAAKDAADTASADAEAAKSNADAAAAEKDAAAAAKDAADVAVASGNATVADKAQNVADAEAAKEAADAAVESANAEVENSASSLAAAKEASESADSAAAQAAENVAAAENAVANAQTVVDNL